MKIKILSVVALSFLLLSCGGKKGIEQNQSKEDTTTSQQDTLEPGIDSIKFTVPETTDPNDVTTNTEVLDENAQLDPNSSPTAVVQTIIKAAKTGKYGSLLKLNNPAVEMDGDAKDIINVANADKSHQKEFNEFFGNAKIVDKPRIKKNLAEVDIETTAEGGEKETIICENKFDKWYLKGL